MHEEKAQEYVRDNGKYNTPEQKAGSLLTVFQSDGGFSIVTGFTKGSEKSH